MLIAKSAASVDVRLMAVLDNKSRSSLAAAPATVKSIPPAEVEICRASLLVPVELRIRLLSALPDCETVKSIFAVPACVIVPDVPVSKVIVPTPVRSSTSPIASSTTPVVDFRPIALVPASISKIKSSPAFSANLISEFTALVIVSALSRIMPEPAVNDVATVIVGIIPLTAVKAPADVIDHVEPEPSMSLPPVDTN